MATVSKDKDDSSLLQKLLSVAPRLLGETGTGGHLPYHSVVRGHQGRHFGELYHMTRIQHSSAHAQKGLISYRATSLHPAHNDWAMDLTFMSINREMDEKSVIHIHNGYYSAANQNEITQFAGKWTEVKIKLHRVR